MTYYIIYQTTCLQNGKIYIGKHITDDLDDEYLGSGTILKKAIEKYGASEFVRAWVAANGSVNGFAGKTHSEETKRKIGKSASERIKKNNPMHDPAVREKVSKLHKGKRFASFFHSGESHHRFGTCWITKDDENKCIPKTDIEKWESEGWTKGRKLKKKPD